MRRRQTTTSASRYAYVAATEGGRSKAGDLTAGAQDPAGGAAHTHEPGDVTDATHPQRYHASKRVTLVGIIVNVVVASMQIVLGVMGNSQALVADGIHTISDVSTDGIVLFALRHGSKAADEAHPYGHSRIETAATAGIGVALIAVALGISINAGRRLMDPEHLAIPAAYTLVAVIVTIVCKEGLYRYAIHVARKYRSKLLRANAWHYRSDAISSVIVLIGIAGSLIGFRYLDAVAAIGVAMMIAKIGWDLAWEALRELVDTGLGAEELAALRDTILSVDGVKDMHLLRTRRMGGQALVDVHIQVDGTISVSEGHHISETVRHRLIDAHESVTDVMVHIDPEDDEITPMSLGLPLRRELMQRLERGFAAAEVGHLIERVTLHYLGGKIRVELLLPFGAAADEGERARLRARLQALVHSGAPELRDTVSEIDVRFH